MQERKAVMARVMVLLPVLLASAVAPGGAQAAATTGIEEACRDAASRRPEISHEHCVSSLSSDRRARDAADLHELAVAATRIAVEHAESTEARLGGLGEVERSKGARARLEQCLELYAASADVLRDALDNLHAGVYGKAKEQLAAALGASESCEDAWKGHESAPVVSHDKEYGRLAVVALGLTGGIV